MFAAWGGARFGAGEGLTGPAGHWSCGRWPVGSTPPLAEISRREKVGGTVGGRVDSEQAVGRRCTGKDVARRRSAEHVVRGQLG